MGSENVALGSPEMMINLGAILSSSLSSRPSPLAALSSELLSHAEGAGTFEPASPQGGNCAAGGHQEMEIEPAKRVELATLGIISKMGVEALLGIEPHALEVSSLSSFCLLIVRFLSWRHEICRIMPGMKTSKPWTPSETSLDLPE